MSKVMNAKNGHRGPNLWDTLIADTELMRSLSFEDFRDPKVERMLTLYKIAMEDMPHQRSVAATLKTGPSLEWLAAERRRQFQLLWLEYATLPDDQKDAFGDGLAEWWSAWCANEQRAAEHIAQHKARRFA
jgi:hypothetical protein